MKKYISLMLVGVMLFLCGCTAINDIHIFEDIQQCEGILENTEGATVKVLDDPSTDRHLKKLTYTAFWGCKYKSSTMSFTLYAYEFEDAAAANNYFEFTTGMSNERQWNFSTSAGMNWYEHIVIDGAKAYRITAPVSDQDDVLALINSVFTKELYSNAETEPTD